MAKFYVGAIPLELPETRAERLKRQRFHSSRIIVVAGVLLGALLLALRARGGW